MLTKIRTKLNKNNKYGTKLNIEHWLWDMARCWVDTWTFKKY